MILSKFMIVVLIILSVLLVLFFIGRKSVSAEVSIDAPKEQVWKVLTDVASVREWNTVLLPVQGEIKEGSKVTYEFYQEEGGKAAKMTASVKQVVSSESINQTGGIPGILTFDHKYMLSASDTGSTVRIEERYRGLMVPFWNPAPVQSAYERLLQSLKVRAELEQSKNESAQ